MSMAKKFIDTDHWNKAFRKLAPSLKLAWFYLWNHCDASGFWAYDLDEMEFRTGSSYKLEDIEKIPGLKFGPEGLLIEDFIVVNYGKLKPDYNPHKPAFRAIEKNGLKLAASLNEAWFKLIDEDEEEDKDEDEEEDEEEGPPKKTKPKPEKLNPRMVERWFSHHLEKAQHKPDWSKDGGKEGAAMKKIISKIRQIVDAERKAGNDKVNPMDDEAIYEFWDWLLSTWNHWQAFHRQLRLSFINQFFSDIITHLKSYGNAESRQARKGPRSGTGYTGTPEEARAAFEKRYGKRSYPPA